MREAYPGAEILAHPECPEDVLSAADFAGSTAAMTDYVVAKKPKQVVLITECSMASNIKGDVPEVNFIGPCNMCPYMKRITLLNIRDCLRDMQFEVTVPEDMIEKAALAVQRMIDLPPPVVPARYDLIKARHHVAVELI
jgi:quinolinate synthase